MATRPNAAADNASIGAKASPGRQTLMSDDSERKIYVVDDDEAVRYSAVVLLESIGLTVEAYDSGQAFLDAFDPSWRGCLVLDIRMPGMSGLELQQALKSRGSQLAIVFVTGHGDIPMAVQAMQDGASHFLEKPYREQALIDAVQHALATGEGERPSDAEGDSAVRERIASLTPRERQVMDMLLEGKANKVMAIDLGVSQRTIELHRANLMHKMQARSLAQLVRMALEVQR